MRPTSHSITGTLTRLYDERFELADDVCVPLAGRRPLLEDGGALLGERRQPALHRLQVVLRFAPAVERQAQAIDLRLEIGKALFEAWGLLLGMHCVLPVCG